MSLEQIVPEQERDLSRAHWQRTTGAVLMREAMQGYFENPTFKPVYTETYEAEANKYSYMYPGVGKPWQRAYVVSVEEILNRPYEHLVDTEVPSSTTAQYDRFTFTGKPYSVLREGLSTQAHFPISLAHTLSQQAAQEYVEGFAVRDLNDIANLISREDFQNMVELSLLAPNGFWRIFSTGIAADGFSATPLSSYDAFRFGKDGSVSFSDLATKTMRDALKRTNKRGDSGVGNIEDESSSGCPARHLRPSASLLLDEVQVLALTDYYGKTVEELMAPSDHTIVKRGLDYIAEIFRQADPYFKYIDANKPAVPAIGTFTAKLLAEQA